MLVLLQQTNIAFADGALYLDKDQKAPYAGILLTPAQAQNQKNIGIERDSYKLLNDSLNKSLDLQSRNNTDNEKEIQILQVDLQNTRSALDKVETANTWVRVGFFVLGCFFTYEAIKVAHEVYH